VGDERSNLVKEKSTTFAEKRTVFEPFPPKLIVNITHQIALQMKKPRINDVKTSYNIQYIQKVSAPRREHRKIPSRTFAKTLTKNNKWTMPYCKPSHWNLGKIIMNGKVGMKSNYIISYRPISLSDDSQSVL
jgi:hypothetical protein